MNDVVLTGVWLAVLGGGLGFCVLLRKLGVPTTYVRDLLHVGAGVWVFSWSMWHKPVAPLAIVGTAAVAIAVLPRLSKGSRAAGSVQRAVSDGDEKWEGITLYTLAFAVMTALAVLRDPFPPAAALWALSFGDGLGGAVGRQFGRIRFTAPGAKTKSVEGTVAVFVAAAFGVWLAANWFGAPVGVGGVLALGAVAALVEALSPRASDNVLIPATVWALAEAIA